MPTLFNVPENNKKQENESSPAGFVRGAAYYGGDDHAE